MPVLSIPLCATCTTGYLGSPNCYCDLIREQHLLHIPRQQSRNSTVQPTINQRENRNIASTTSPASQPNHSNTTILNLQFPPGYTPQMQNVQWPPMSHYPMPDTSRANVPPNQEIWVASDPPYTDRPVQGLHGSLDQPGTGVMQPPYIPVYRVMDEPVPAYEEIPKSNRKSDKKRKTPLPVEDADVGEAAIIEVTPRERKPDKTKNKSSPPKNIKYWLEKAPKSSGKKGWDRMQLCRRKVT